MVDVAIWLWGMDSTVDLTMTARRPTAMGPGSFTLTSSIDSISTLHSFSFVCLSPIERFLWLDASDSSWFYCLSFFYSWLGWAEWYGT